MIHIKDNWYCEAAADCYTVMRDTGKLDKDGNPVYSDRKYPRDLSGAISIVLRETLSERLNEHDMSLVEALNVVNKTHDEFMEVLTVIQNKCKVN